MPIIDLGNRAGRLHRDAPRLIQHQQEYNGPPLRNSNDKEKAEADEATEEHFDEHVGGKKPEPASTPEDALSLRERSSKTIHDSQQSEHAELRDHKPLPVLSDNWWATGTQYALQPHIAERKPTIPSIGDTNFRGDWTPKSGTFSSLAASHDINGNERRNRQLLRVLQPAEGNKARGKRIFFLA